MVTVPVLFGLTVGVVSARPQWNPTSYTKQFASWKDWLLFLFLMSILTGLGFFAGIFLAGTGSYAPEVAFLLPYALLIGLLGGKAITAWRIQNGNVVASDGDEEDESEDDRVVSGPPSGFPTDEAPDSGDRDESAGKNVLERSVRGQGNFDVPSDLADEANVIDVVDKNPKEYREKYLRVSESFYEEEIPPSTFRQRRGSTLREDFDGRESYVPRSFEDATYEFLVPGSDTRSTCSGCGGSGRTDCSRCRGSGKDTCSECSGSGQVTEQETCSTCNGDGGNRCRACNGSGSTKTEETCPTCNGNRKQMVTCQCGGDGVNQRGYTCTKCGGDGTLWATCEDCGGTGTRQTTTNCSSCGGSGQQSCSACHGNGYTEYQARCSNCAGDGRVTCSSCSGSGKVTCSTCDGEQETITFEKAKREFTPSEDVMYEPLDVPVEILEAASSVVVGSNEAYTGETVVKHQKVTERVPLTEVVYEYAGETWEVFDPKQDNTIRRVAGPEDVAKELKLLAASLVLFGFPFLLFWLF